MEGLKYNLSFAELIDRLNICQMKSVFSKQAKSSFYEEIADILSDIDTHIEKGVKIDAEVIRAIIILTQSNLEIWKNEDAVRLQTNEENYEKTAKMLLYTHSMNSTRCEAKTRIQNLIGGRTDPKINYIGGAWSIKW